MDDRRRSTDRELGGVEVRLDTLENEVRGLRTEVAEIRSFLHQMTGARKLVIGFLMTLGSIAAIAATFITGWLWR